MKEDRIKTNSRIKTAVLVAALAVFFITDGIVLFMACRPEVEIAAEQKQWQGLDLLKKYSENPDMIGWLQVEGTNINYPVLRGEKYLTRNFGGRSDASGSIFVSDDWGEDDMCTLIHGHNMWMYGTMLNQLHLFKEADFFQDNRIIKFYVIEDGGRAAEKRTYEVLCCSLISIDEWNFASCRYMCSGEELAAFASECRRRAVQERFTEDSGDDGYENLIVLSTCSYHVEGDGGRLLLVGQLTDRREQNRIDVDQSRNDVDQQ